MSYKKDPWYIGGRIATYIAAAVMAVCMIFMYFGSNAAIVWFFAMCPVLTAGILLCRSVVNRYEDAEASSGEPLPMFWRVRFAYHNLKVLVVTRDLWRAIMTAVTCVFLGLTVILGGTCLFSLYSKNGAQNDPYFITRNHIYDQCFEIWQRNRDDGNSEHKNVSFAIMQDMLEKNHPNRERIETNGKRIESVVPWVIVSATATGMSAVVLLSYIVHKKSKSKQK